MLAYSARRRSNVDDVRRARKENASRRNEGRETSLSPSAIHSDE
jgi:hypothetical protein